MGLRLSKQNIPPYSNINAFTPLSDSVPLLLPVRKILLFKLLQHSDLKVGVGVSEALSQLSVTRSELKSELVCTNK